MDTANNFFNDAGAYDAWDTASLIRESHPLAYKCLLYAMLSANTHNIQPWKFELTPEGILLLYIDHLRLLPDTDPDLRHIYISQGTFLETLSIAASHFGASAKIDFFPKGEDTILRTGSSPIAAVRIAAAGSAADRLFAQIPRRHTSHSVFKPQSMSNAQKDKISACHAVDRFVVRIISDESLRKQINTLLIEAMSIQTSIGKTHEETIKMMRYGRKSVSVLRDGFSFSDLGVSGIKLFLLDRIATESFVRSRFFKKNIVRGVSAMAHSAQDYGVIYSPLDDRIDQVVSGQILTRVYLTVCQEGLSIQPMDHVLQKYAELSDIETKMRKLLEYNGMTPQCFFRIGQSTNNKEHHTPRRKFSEMLIN